MGAPASYLAPPLDTVLYQEIVRCEGYRAAPYKDGLGNITIGVGWNLTSNGLPSWIITALYNLALEDAEAVLNRVAPWWIGLDPVRQRAMQNLAFNLGGKLSGFPIFLSDMQAGRWASAAAELENSEPWFSEVGQRGPMLVEMISSGEDPVL